MLDLSHEQVRAYLQSGRTALTASEQAAVDDHLRDCADCRAYADHMIRLQAALGRVMHQRWDAQPVPKFAPRVLPRLQKSKFPRQVFSSAIGLGALAVLILLLQAFFNTQLQPTAQSPVATEPSTADATMTPPVASTALAATPFNVRPTPTPPSGRDFYRVQRLTNTMTGAFRPAVSPDGQRVVYVSERDGNWDIYVLDLNTQVETRLTDDPLPDMAPAWSPDGRQVAYQHNVLSADGPVLVDYTVMNADGSNKRVVFSGAHWPGNEAPAWSPSGDRIAVADSGAIVIVSVTDRREVQRLAPPDSQGVSAPAWFDEQQVLFVSNGQLMLGDVKSEIVQQALGLSGPVNFGMIANSKIIYVGQNGATQIGEVQLDGAPPIMWANFPPDSIEYAEPSPDGVFVAVQADSGLYLTTRELPASWQSQPLFRLDQNVPPSDLLSVSWLPDSSGFIFVSSVDGRPELHLAQLNLSAIDYLKSLSQVPPATVPSPPEPPAPTPTPIQLALLDSSTIKVSRVAFWPDQSVVFDRNVASDFGLALQADATMDTTVHVVAYGLRPDEILPDCLTRSVPVDRPFWSNQADYAAGAITFDQRFVFADEQVGADRFVVRLSVLDAAASDRLLYCAQQVYAVSINVTPAPSTPAPPTPLTPTPLF